jgi:hypothetical protein
MIAQTNSKSVSGKPDDSIFGSNNTYRGVVVPPKWVNTSKCAGKECVSRLLADPTRIVLDDVMAYKNVDVVARIEHDVGVSPEKAEAIFEDVKQFLFMSAQNQTHDMIPTPTIDEGWHAFILFTEDYADFCKRYFGTFIHHTAHRVGEPRCPRINLLPSIDAMHRVFGKIPSENWNYIPAPNDKTDYAKLAA